MSISSVMGTALSGMQAQVTRVGAAASNVANSSTPGYGRLNTGLHSTGSGVAAVVTPTEDEVDPATELTDLVGAEQSYKANAAVFEAGADLWDVLMSIKRD